MANGNMGFMNGWDSGFTSYDDDLARIYHLLLASCFWDLGLGLRARSGMGTH
jgi:hypothetical protein